MWGNIISAGIGAAASLIGGRKSQKGQEAANAQNEALQREFAQNGIRWKVADAQAAGLHPLYALGGAGAAYQPSAQNVMAGPAASLDAVGQNISRAVQASASSHEQEANRLQLELLRSQIRRNDIEGAAVASQSQRDWQQSWMAKPINLDGTGVQLGNRPFDLASLSGDFTRSRGPASLAQRSVLDRTKGTPSEYNLSRGNNSAIEAATAPAYKEYFVSPLSDLTALAYASDEGYGEARENMAPLEFFLANYGRGGWDWMRRYLQEVYMGKAPQFRNIPSGKELHGQGFKPKGWSTPFKRGSGRSQ